MTGPPGKGVAHGSVAVRAVPGKVPSPRRPVCRAVRPTERAKSYTPPYTVARSALSRTFPPFFQDFFAPSRLGEGVVVELLDDLHAADLGLEVVLAVALLHEAVRHLDAIDLLVVLVERLLGELLVVAAGEVLGPALRLDE